MAAERKASGQVEPQPLGPSAEPRVVDVVVAALRARQVHVLKIAEKIASGAALSIAAEERRDGPQLRAGPEDPFAPLLGVEHARPGGQQIRELDHAERVAGDAR